MTSHFPEDRVMRTANRHTKKTNAFAQYDHPKFSAALVHSRLLRLCREVSLFTNKPRKSMSPWWSPQEVKTAELHTLFPRGTPFHLYLEKALADQSPPLKSSCSAESFEGAWWWQLHNQVFHMKYRRNLLGLDVSALSDDVQFRSFLDDSSCLVVLVEHPALFDFFHKNFASSSPEKLSPSLRFLIRQAQPSVHCFRLEPYGVKELYRGMHSHAIFRHFQQHHSVAVPIPEALRSSEALFPLQPADASSSSLPQVVSDAVGRWSDRQLSKKQRWMQRKDKQRKLAISRKNDRSQKQNQ